MTESIKRRGGMAAPAKSDHHLALGQAIRNLRVRSELSQQALGVVAGKHRNYIGRLERGELNPSFAKLLQLTDGLGVELSELVAEYERLHRVDDRRP